MKDKTETYRIVFIGMIAIITMVVGMAVASAQTIHNESEIVKAFYNDKTVHIQTEDKPERIVMRSKKKVYRNFEPRDNGSIISVGRLPKGKYIIKVIFKNRTEIINYEQ